MTLLIGELTEHQAKQICGWQYFGEYDVYNLPPWNEMVNTNWGLADEYKRKNEFKSVSLNGVFIGFFRLQCRENKLYLGLGLAPEYCGKGYGSELIKIVKNHARNYFPKNNLYLDVRKFNIRAIKSYLKSGFRIEGEYVKNGVKFVVMKCDLLGGYFESSVSGS